MVNNKLILNSTDELNSLNLDIKGILDSKTFKFNNLLKNAVSDFSKLIISNKNYFDKIKDDKKQNSSAKNELSVSNGRYNWKKILSMKKRIFLI